MTNGRSPSGRAAHEPSPQDGLGHSVSVPNAAMKAVYYDMTVRAIREWVRADREALVEYAESAIQRASNEGLWRYAEYSAEKIAERAARLSAFAMVLEILNPDHAAIAMEARQGGDAKQGSVHDSAGRKASPGNGGQS